MEPPPRSVDESVRDFAASQQRLRPSSLRSVAVPYLLYEPTVAIRVVEGEEGSVIATFGIKPRRLPFLSEVEGLAHVYSPLHEIGTGSLDVVHHQVQTLD